MADGSIAAAPLRQDGSGAIAERARFIAFVADAVSEATLREGLSGSLSGPIDIRRMTCRQAIGQLRKTATPQVIIVDISGEEQPVSLLVDLSEVVEPDARVLVIGDRQDVNFYRQITRGLGVLEYLYKPLARNMIERHFGPWIDGGKGAVETIQGGRIISITGSGGGVGATTIAVNLAWHFATEARRHTVLLDSNLHTGTAALALGATSGSGLRTALETPHRVDELLVERSTFPVSDRLALLSSEERLEDTPPIAPNAAQALIATLRRRYNFVIVDVPFRPTQLNRDLIDFAHQRVLVVDPTLPSLRDALRLLAMPITSGQGRRPIIVLNRFGLVGTLSKTQIEETLGTPPDVVIPYQPRLVNQAITTATPAVTTKGAFRNGILKLAQEAASVWLAGADFDGLAKRPTSVWKRLLEWRR
jgi:pilus assembly protein CpaE